MNHMKALLHFFNDIFRAWGFRSGRDYFQTVLGIKSFVMVPSQAFVTTAGTCLAFWGTWIWNPPGAAFLILGMDLVNAWYGYKANNSIRGEAFSLHKFQKTWATMVSDIFGFAMLHLAAKYYPHFQLACDGLFAYFFSFKFWQIWDHWAVLKLQNGSFKVYLRDYALKILQSKVGADVVDSIQERPLAGEATPAVVLLPPETPPPGAPTP